MNDIIELTFPTGFFLLYLLIIYVFRIKPRVSPIFLRIINISLITSVVLSVLIALLAFNYFYLEWKIQQLLLWSLLLFTALSFLFRKDLENVFNLLYRRFLLGIIGVFIVFCISNLMVILYLFDINLPFKTEKNEVVYNDSSFKVKYIDRILATSYSPTVLEKHFIFYKPIGVILDFPREEILRIDEIKKMNQSTISMKYIKLGGVTVDTLIHFDNRR